MKKLFAILIMCSLSLPVLAIDGQALNDGEKSGVNTELNVETVAPEELQKKETPELNEELKPVPVALPSKYKEPMSKKKLAKKFIIAMLCVAGTSIFLYGALTLYNKFRDGFFDSQAPIPPEGERPLDTPKDLTEAVKTFVDKTHWD